MARPIWKGHVSFGLVNVPVTLYSAEKRTDLRFHLIDRRNHARVRYKRVNEQTGEDVPWDEIVKGYEYSDDQFVLLDDEDFRSAAIEATQSVDIQSFVKREEIEYLYYDKPYFLVPSNQRANKSYVLLREALKQSDSVGVAKVVIRTKQYLAALIPQNEALIVDLLRFADQLRDTSEFTFPSSDINEHKITKQEMRLSQQLVESMSAEWDPAQYHDDYSQALLDWIEKKVEAGQFEPAPSAPEERKALAEAGVIDLTKLLKQSVSKKDKSQGKARSKKKRKASARRTG